MGACIPREPAAAGAPVALVRQPTHAGRAGLGTGVGPLELLVLQATPFCNIDCRYCYLTDRTDTARMPADVLRSVFRRVFSHPGLVDPVRGFTVCWHAGEPLVAGIPYYRQAVELAREQQVELGFASVPLVHSFQTNATLVDEAWCEFFHSIDARVGVSIDGPAALHDRYRVDRLGRGTHERVMRGIRHLHDAAIRMHVIAVVTEASLDDPDVFYDFFRSLDVAVVGLNVEEIENAHGRSSLPAEGVSPRFRRFIARLFERSAGERSVRFRELEALRAMILGGPPPPERLRNSQVSRPLAIISCDYRGNVSTFSPELLGARSGEFNDFVFGNVMVHSLAELLDQQHFRSALQQIRSGIDRCEAQCEYFDLCRGGTPSNKFFELGSLAGTETLYCRHAKMAVVDAALDVLESHSPAAGDALVHGA